MANEMPAKFNLRDEIAEADIKYLDGHIDLSAYELKPINELGAGDTVLHNGVWQRIEEYAEQIDSTPDGNANPIRLTLVWNEAITDGLRMGGNIQVIVMPHEEFYVRAGE